jgi:hypothetical protein
MDRVRAVLKSRRRGMKWTGQLAHLGATASGRRGLFILHFAFCIQYFAFGLSNAPSGSGTPIYSQASPREAGTT